MNSHTAARADPAGTLTGSRPARSAHGDDALHAYQRLPEVARYLYRPPLTREQCARSLALRAAGTAWTEDGDDLVVAVCRAEDGALVGEVVLKLASARARQAEIGWIFHPAHGGRGYAAEAARAVAALAFGELAVHRLFARLDVLNTGSVRVCERLGMRREAHLVDNDLDGERWGSEYVYALLAREWRAGEAI
ncbi:GNAT family N-acetyltransferase [Streptomyces sp. SID8366]|uniref:GNAT family N-acetyltransferase n=1 Tax=unclassified Streptomyces TaxID=2593676 RepID=UPI000DB974EA|nr:GNAT family protein [Streptomyces sp. PsTaAH-130]MYU06895.1 GNAT family N-acetyltransferase [Streptomyces sp. SID8366]MYU61564.1 GNAT family N-acetyltransferase [Streptomyces sp. SID69]RAJ47981.1 RimJ/RimL family protein N-acetyltransferase [Streptomyces sp. PsTaAH-130]